MARLCRLAPVAGSPMMGRMFNEPYLETCCRAALHRLFLAGTQGRPGEEKDGPCLTRLSGMGLVCETVPGRFILTETGAARHAREILKQPLPTQRTPP